MSLIEERVVAARAGTNPNAICRMRSGWAVLGDVVVQNGTPHAWLNVGDEDAVLAAVMIGARRED